jgi:hypothetical protein
MTLQELQKQSRATTISSSAAAGAGSKQQKKGEEDEELNIHMLMDDIKRDILDVYALSHSSKDGPPTEGKQTIEILEVSFIQFFAKVFCKGHRNPNRRSHKIFNLRGGVPRLEIQIKGG